jgi:hypothetical protein
VTTMSIKDELGQRMRKSVRSRVLANEWISEALHVRVTYKINV